MRSRTSSTVVWLCVARIACPAMWSDADERRECDRPAFRSFIECFVRRTAPARSCESNFVSHISAIKCAVLDVFLVRLDGQTTTLASNYGDKPCDASARAAWRAPTEFRISADVS